MKKRLFNIYNGKRDAFHISGSKQDMFNIYFSTQKSMTAYFQEQGKDDLNRTNGNKILHAFCNNENIASTFLAIRK